MGKFIAVYITFTPKIAFSITTLPWIYLYYCSTQLIYVSFKKFQFSAKKSLWKACLSFHMLKHSILDILILRSTPLKHLNYPYYALWYLPYVRTDSYSCCLRAQVMVPFNSSKVSLTVLAAISCISVNLFCSVSDTTRVFCLNRIPFHYFFCKFHWYFISPRSAISSITLSTKGLGKRGQPESLWGQPDFYQEVARWATYILQELLRPDTESCHGVHQIITQHNR